MLHARADRLALEVETRVTPALPADVDAGAWRAHGRLTPAEERRCHLEAMRSVVIPCARALVEREAGAPSATVLQA